MKNLTLVILAAGMGSRFGGLKQIEPFGPNGEFIIDYSIYDAIKAGFTKVVFIIKKENYETFKETIGKRIENKIDVSYVFQEIDNLPDEISFEKRIKPLGTAQAIWCCKDVCKDNFAIINADDFYGRDAFLAIAKFLQETKDEFGMVGYKVINTLTENGSVKRGVCEEKNGYLTSLIESSVVKKDDKIICTPLDCSNSFFATSSTIVSMNMFGFTPKIFDFIKQGFYDFYKENINNLESCEYLIPEVVFDNIKNNNIKVKVLKTSAKWYGVTYQEDKKFVSDALLKMTNDGIYKSPLWK